MADSKEVILVGNLIAAVVLEDVRVKEVYTVFAERLDYEPIELWEDSRKEYVLYGRIAFWPNSERKPKCWLCLNRKWVVEGKIERYAGPVITVIAGADAENGIELAELNRTVFRLTLNPDAATNLEVAEIRVELDVPDADFLKLQTELLEMFADSGVFRLHESTQQHLANSNE